MGESVGYYLAERDRFLHQSFGLLESWVALGQNCHRLLSNKL